MKYEIIKEGDNISTEVFLKFESWHLYCDLPDLNKYLKLEAFGDINHFIIKPGSLEDAMFHVRIINTFLSTGKIVVCLGSTSFILVPEEDNWMTPLVFERSKEECHNIISWLAVHKSKVLDFIKSSETKVTIGKGNLEKL